MLVLVLASCFAEALGAATGRECESTEKEIVRLKKRCQGGKEGERERVREGRNMALAQLCGTFDMSFESSHITRAKTNTLPEKSYALFEKCLSAHPFPPPQTQ